MALWNQFPQTDFHELNLDWVLKNMKYIIDQWESFSTNVEVTYEVGSVPSVSVSGDLKDGLSFNFVLVKGEKGDRGDPGTPGADGEDGNGIQSCTFSNDRLTLHFTDGTSYTTPSLKGDPGSGLEILDVYPDLASLQTAHPTGVSGDAYMIGSDPNYRLYIWSVSSQAWTNVGTLTSPSASVSVPLMDGTAAAGSDLQYSRADHVHPSDTSKQDVLTAGRGIDLTGSTLSVEYADLDGADLDSVNYLYSGRAVNVTNQPTDASDNGELSVISDGVSITQLYSADTGGYYIRKYDGSSWDGWYEVMLSDGSQKSLVNYSMVTVSTDSNIAANYTGTLTNATPFNQIDGSDVIIIPLYVNYGAFTGTAVLSGTSISVTARNYTSNAHTLLGRVLVLEFM